MVTTSRRQPARSIATSTSPSKAPTCLVVDAGRNAGEWVVFRGAKFRLFEMDEALFSAAAAPG